MKVQIILNMKRKLKNNLYKLTILFYNTNIFFENIFKKYKI